MRSAAVRWGLVVGLALAPGARAQSEDEAREEDVSECAFAKDAAGRPGQLVRTAWEVCGASMCSSFERVEVGFAGQEALLDVESDSGLLPGAGNAVDSLGVECAPGKVVLRSPGAGVPAVALEYRAGRFAFAPELPAKLEEAWKAPGPPPWSARGLEGLSTLLEKLQPIDAGPSHAVRLLRARGFLREERWDKAQELLQFLKEEALAPERAARREALLRELEEARARSVPLRVKWTRLGALSRTQALPLAKDVEAPTLFWRGASLCVAQEDASPPTHMRCHDTAAGRWGARTRYQLPRGAPRGVVDNFGGRVCLYANNCWHPGLPALEDSCGGFLCDEVLAVAPGPMVLTPGPNGLRAETKKGPHDVGAEEARALLLKTLGSRLVGGARYYWGLDGRLRPVGQPEKSWDVLGMAPPSASRPEVAWLGPPLVSPDGQWAAGVAGNGDKAEALWLGRLEPTKP